MSTSIRVVHACIAPRAYASAVAIRVILGEDNYLVREGLRQVLAGAPQLELEAECGDGDELLREVEARRPDVVLTDIRMPPTHTDEGSGSPPTCAPRTRTSAWSS